MKVEKKNTILLYSWLPIEFIIKNWRFWKKKYLKSGKFGHFFQEKSFAQVEIIYFRHENSSSKVTLTHSHPTALLVQH
jgi:hypothetical protein